MSPLPAERSSRPVLLAGVPRSGTTWVAGALGRCEDTDLVLEPDNAMIHPYALHKRHLPGGAYYAVTPEQPGAMERLWREACGLGPDQDSRVEALRRRAARRLLRHTHKARVRAVFSSPSRLAPTLRAAEALAVPARPRRNSRVVTKSVEIARSLEWVAAVTGADVCLIQRDLRGVLSSWLELGWVEAGEDNEIAVADPRGLADLANVLEIAPPPIDALGRTTWLLAVLHRTMADAAVSHADWTVVNYEDLLDDPPVRLAALATTLGLVWGADAEEFISSSNQPGTGYQTRRVTSEARDVWKHRLSEEQEQRILEVAAAVGVTMR